MLSPKKLITWITVSSVFLCTSWFFSYSMPKDKDIYQKIDRGLFYLKEVFETISQNYVDELDPEELSKSAIQGMLKEFDPYTVFFEDPGSQNIRMITRGKYGGIGMEIGIQNDNITIIVPMEGTPAKRAGIRSGDIIKLIDNISTKRMSLEDVSQKLRGKIGTTVSLKIMRPGIDEPIPFKLIREEIILKDVVYKDFIEPGVAYIRLSGFSDKAAKEVKEALKELNSKVDIKNIILDLRNNPGGLLTSAVKIVNIFLEPGKLVVYTRGSHENENKFYTREKPLFPDLPLIVLVNEASASASEIVAGAIQDMDRGILVGTETFGKGLVQKVYPIDKLSQAYLKITTAKYYIPSGRSIQKDDYKRNTNVFMDMSDSVEYNSNINYYTQNGRIVHGGGGIKPDIKVETLKVDRFLQNLISKGYFFRFAIDYLTRHPHLNTKKNFKITPEIFTDFKMFIERENFKFTMEGEKELTHFIKISKTNHYGEDLQDLIEIALQKLKKEKTKKYKLYQEKIIHLLEAEFSEKTGGFIARIQSTLKHDKQVKKAIELCRNIEQYQEVLAIGTHNR